MGKVYILMRHDNSLDMDIPHDIEMAVAMYGFRELAAEIVPYHIVSEIYDRVTRDDIVVDYMSQCKTIFKKFGAEPNLPDYPTQLQKYLGRKIWKDTIDSISRDESKWSAGNFVKPVTSKAFTGKIISSLKDLEGCGSYTGDAEVLVSEPIDIAAEWRCFILYDKILDVRPYSMFVNPEKDAYRYGYDPKTLDAILEDFKTWAGRPAACAIDICQTKDGRTLLVELNDAYALGSYGLFPIFYARMISARWSQLLGRPDEYDFRMV